MDDDLRRVVAVLGEQIRALETRKDPIGQQLVAEFRDLQRRVLDLDREVPITSAKLGILTEDAKDLDKKVDHLVEQRGSDARKNFYILVSAIISVVIVVVAALILAGLQKGP